MLLPLGSRYIISSEGYILNDRLQQKIYGAQTKTGQRIVRYFNSCTGKYRSILISRLVAEVFLPQPTVPVCQLQVDHIDHDVSNNDASNLRYCSRSENLRNRQSWKWRCNRMKDASTQTLGTNHKYL